MKKIISILAVALAFTIHANAQKDFGGIARFDSTVMDFGTISAADGPQSHTFTVTNIGKEDMVIYAVMTSCGCTKVNWTRETIAPGKTGTISATYSNDEGPYPFDKTLKAYISGIDKPVILHMRGEVTKKK